MGRYLGIDVDEQEWIDSIPRFVLVRGVRWTIRLEDSTWKGVKRYYGLTDYENRVIHVSRMQAPDDVLDTLFHELTHLIWSEYGLPQRPTEERTATAFGAGWAALFVQNPGLLTAIDALRAAVGGQD